MPINVEHNVDPRLLGQAAYQAGQGQGARDALALLARYGRGGGAPQQQNFNMGSLPQSGVGQVSDAIANGDAGGDQGLQQDMSIRQGDSGGAFYDPATTAQTPKPYNPNSIYNADGTYSENFYGGPEGDAAAGMQPWDEASQARLDSVAQKHSLIENDPRFSRESKDDAHQQIDAQFTQSKAYKPLTRQLSMSDVVSQNSFTDPNNGVSYFRDPHTGKIQVMNTARSGSQTGNTDFPVPQIMTNDVDGTPLDPNTPVDPATAFNSQTVRGSDGNLYTRDAKGSWKLLSKTKPDESQKQDELSVHDVARLESQARKDLATPDPNDPAGRRMIPPSQDQVDSYVDRMLQRHQTLKARRGMPPQAQSAQQPAPQDNGGQSPDDADAQAAQQSQSRALPSQPIPPADAPFQVKVQSLNYHLQRLAVDPRYQALGPAGKSAAENALQNMIMAGGDQQ